MSRLFEGIVEISCYVALPVNLNSRERLVSEYLDEIKLKTLYAGCNILLIFRIFKALIILLVGIILLSSVK